ncbi:MAG: DUF1553 domain-containing protein [Armatimonadota bacterium]
MRAPGRRLTGFAALGTLLGVPLYLALSAPASAKPAHLKALEDHYGPTLAGGLASCATCHDPSKATGKAPESLADFPHNAFGKRLAAAAEELQKEGKRADIATRLRRAAGEDSDGDGAANQTEILAGRRPGDAQDRPTAAELRAARLAQRKLIEYQSAYRWRPFEPVSRPSVPKVARKAGLRNPIDFFLQSEREQRGLEARPEAAKLTLLRRVYLDLIGLSPTPEEQRAFLADHSPHAYDKLVDRLLASPHYGERWGRHWMDVWRYSDWTGWGEQVRDSQPHIWRWRDWIIDSLNADKPYDRMIVEMLAADEVAPLDTDALRATGYLARNFKLLSREKWMQDVVDHTGQAFLGLTVGCARCHDHMHDPISQKDYYRLRAIFEPHQVRADWVPGQLDRAKDGLPRAYDANLEAKTYFYVRGDERHPLKDEPLQPGVPEALGGRFEIRPVELPLLARYPEKQPHVIAALREDAAAKVATARKALEGCESPEESELARLKLDAAEAGRSALEAVLQVEVLEDAGKKGSPEWEAAARETVRRQREQAAADASVRHLEQSRLMEAVKRSGKTAPDKLKQGEEMLARAAETLEGARAALGKPLHVNYKPRLDSNFPATSTGRRTALARWVATPENPLTARVAVNQIWFRHFGEALLPSVENFGRGGVPPVHPQLLDWLASELMAKGWRMKPIHRLIVTSSAYRMASTPHAANLKKDPDNLYLWRMNSRRLDAELVRDNVLYVSGQLDATLGGPEIDQHQGMKVKRRTLYFRHAPEKEMVFTALFDGPNPVECYRRKETIVPQQALALANSEVALVQSRHLARLLLKSSGDSPDAFTRGLFERVLARPATTEELRECVRFLAEQEQLLRGKLTGAVSDDLSKPSQDPKLRARENLALVLLNHNDFVTVR